MPDCLAALSRIGSDLVRDVSLTAVAAGFLAVLISFAGPLLIFYQAAVAMDVGPGLFSTWVAAIFLGAGIASIVLSLQTRLPILIAWSAPGNVLLITVGPQLGYAEVVGAYLVSAVAILIIGATGLFDWLVKAIPRGLASGMMAGILFRFGAEAFLGFESRPILVAVTLVGFLVLSAITPRYALIWLLVGVLIFIFFLSGTETDTLTMALPPFEPAWPAFTAEAMLGFAVPLILTTLTGQFLAGLAILKANGFDTPARPILLWSSLLSIPAAVFGGVTIALASITMALGASRESHPDPTRRYVAGVASGSFFLLGAVLAGSVVGLLQVLPVELVALLAGLALLGAIGKGIVELMADETDRDAGLLTFIITASGLSAFGIGAAFWGLLVGLLAAQVTRIARRAQNLSS